MFQIRTFFQDLKIHTPFSIWNTSRPAPLLITMTIAVELALRLKTVWIGNYAALHDSDILLS